MCHIFTNVTDFPLVRETAFRLKKDFPDTVMLINGQIASLDEAKALVDAGMDGVMVGRAAYQNPWMLAGVDEVLYGVEHDVTRLECVHRMTALASAASSTPKTVSLATFFSLASTSTSWSISRQFIEINL